MANRKGSGKQRRVGDGIFRPENCAALDPQEFAFALSVGVAAASYRMPMKSPTEYHIDIEGKDGDTRRLAPTDIPINRSAFAILDQVDGDSQKFESIMARQIALLLILESEEAKAWVREDETGRSIHPAMVEAAATMPLRSTFDFDSHSFLERVGSIAERMERENTP